jgi:hypothetical protein
MTVTEYEKQSKEQILKIIREKQKQLAKRLWLHDFLLDKKT